MPSALMKTMDNLVSSILDFSVTFGRVDFPSPSRNTCLSCLLEGHIFICLFVFIFVVFLFIGLLDLLAAHSQAFFLWTTPHSTL